MARKKIIAAVINDLSHDRRMQRICTALADAGYEVVLVGRQLNNSKPLKSINYSQKRLKCWVNKGPMFYLEYNLRLFFYLLFTPFDIGNSTDADTLSAVGLACLFKRKPFAHDAHEYFTEVPELIHRPFVKSVWLRIERFFVPKAAIAYTVSTGIARIYEQKFQKHFDLIMNAPPFQDFEHPQSPNRNLLIYQGALKKGRGIEAILHAMQSIGADLWIAGSGDIEDALKQMTFDLKLNDKVKFLGIVDPDELTIITRQASIGLNLCEPLGLNYYYALSNKGFDYIHAGLPAVTNDFPEYQVLNQKFETMLLVQTNPEEIAHAVNRLISDDVLYERLRKNCFLAANELNWQHESVKLIKLYEKLG